MHPSAQKNAKLFYEHYCKLETPTIVEIGSQNVNGSIRDYAPQKSNYIGLDFAAGKGVDVVLTDAYKYPIEDNSVDIVVSSSCFEHADFFWLSYLEAMRILKPTGLFYLNVPSTGIYHEFPVDCWRFYPDSGKALSNWGNRNNYDCVLLESYITNEEQWEDCVSIFLKDAKHKDKYESRVTTSHQLKFKNVYVS
jgi:SAM-dependent methyltransferase